MTSERDLYRICRKCRLFWHFLRQAAENDSPFISNTTLPLHKLVQSQNWHNNTVNTLDLLKHCPDWNEGGGGENVDAGSCYHHQGGDLRQGSWWQPRIRNRLRTYCSLHGSTLQTLGVPLGLWLLPWHSASIRTLNAFLGGVFQIVLKYTFSSLFWNNSD